MEFIVNSDSLVPSSRILFFMGKRSNNWHVIIEDYIRSYKIDRRNWQLKMCYENLSDCVYTNVRLLVPCLYEDDQLGIYEMPELGYVAIYSDHVFAVEKGYSDKSKIVYKGKKVYSDVIVRYVTVNTRKSQDGMYEFIPSLIDGRGWLVKTMDNEIRLSSKLCDYLMEGGYPVKYIDDFIKLVRRYEKMEQGGWLYEKWRELKFNLEKLLHDEEVLERLLL